MAIDFREFIEEMMGRHRELFTAADFTECQQAAADWAELVRNLEATEVKFRRKLTETAAETPQNKEQIIYLQGVCDGINLMLGPLKSHRPPQSE